MVNRNAPEIAAVAPDHRGHEDADSKHGSSSPKKGGGAASYRRRGRHAEGHTIRNLFHLAHRVAILLAAIVYLTICAKATVAMMNLLKDKQYPTHADSPFMQYLMTPYLGTTTLRESPMVLYGLMNDTTPRNGTLYLEAAGPKFTICTGISPLIYEMYSEPFLRSIYNSIVRDTKYNLTFLAEEETELIMPVVDCLSVAVIGQFQPLGKYNFLVRKVKNPDDVYIVSILLSNQEYHIDSQSERGSAGVAMFSFINDLRATSVEHYFAISLGYPYAEFNFRAYTYLDTTEDNYWRLQSIPNEASGEIPKILTTSQRAGFFMKSATEQINASHAVFLMATKPIDDIAQWVTATKAVMHDSWAWVHGVQIFLGLDLLLNLIVLVLVSLRNLQAGKLWIGDAFVSISNKLLLRGALVLISWGFNGFWALYEFCLFDSYNVMKLPLTIYEDIMHADLLCLYFCLCGILGKLFRERVDPIVAILSFAIGYELRGALILMFPDNLLAMVMFGYYNFLDGIPPYQEGQETLSTMTFWNVHVVNRVTASFPLQTLVPIISTLIFVLAYIVYCKVYRYFVPEKAHVLRNTTGTATSGGEEMLLTQKRVLTLFEIATGAELESRFGLMSSYEKHLFIKGMKFASADGIYSNGFVIANGKFLLQTGDYWHIVAMKLLQRRYKNVFVYEIAGSTVQQTAKLVYPHTFTISDLVNLNITVLS